MAGKLTINRLTPTIGAVIEGIDLGHDLDAGEFAQVHDALIEGIVIGDDDLMERYLADETISTDELAGALASGVAQGTVFPVLCGSATKLVGVDLLAHAAANQAADLGR